MIKRIIKKIKGSNRGYTLLDVLLAAAVLGMAAVPLTSLFMNSYNYVKASGGKTTALAYGVQEMERLKSQEYSALKGYVENGKEQSPVDPDLLTLGYERYHKIQEVEKKIWVNGEERTADVLLLEVYISYGASTGSRQIVLTYYLPGE